MFFGKHCTFTRDFVEGCCNWTRPSERRVTIVWFDKLYLLSQCYLPRTQQTSMHKYTFFIFKSLLQCESSFTKPLDLKSKGISMYFPCISHPFAPPKNVLSLHQKPPFISSTCTVSLCCLWISLLPQFISTWRSFWHISSWHLTTWTSGRHFLASPQGTLKNQKQQGKTGKIPTKSRTSQPAIKNVWLRFWYVLISVFFVHAFKAWSCFCWSSTTARFVTSKGISVPFLRPLRSSDHPKKATRVN